MGFIEDLFGGQNLELEVRGYFAGSRSTYDAMRMCMHEMVSLKYYSSNLSHKHIDKIRAELFRNAEEQYMRDYYHVAEQRCRVDRDYTFFRPISGEPSIEDTFGAHPAKSSRAMRCMLVSNDSLGWAWLSLYDDGTRMRPYIEMYDSGRIPWKVVVPG
jgi:hypothetical protein